MRPVESTKHRTIIRHRRDPSGKVQSLALYYAMPGAPPTMLYAFEDGHIRAIDARVYRRHGNGFVRTKSRVTVFDTSGHPTAQLELTPDGPTVGQADVRSNLGLQTALRAVKDVASVFLPAPLHAEEVTGPCTTEWWAWTAASGAVAVTTAALAAAVAACPATGITCVAAFEAGVKLAAAIAAWSYAMDKYIACDEAAKGATTGSGGGGSIRPEESDVHDSYFDDTVQAFVDRAIDSGNYWCSSDGNYCIYYAAT